MVLAKVIFGIYTPLEKKGIRFTEEEVIDLKR
jgi:hypothetical protein